MSDNKGLTKFLDAQNQIYLTALAEIKRGRKESHWMWFVFPQIAGLGHSTTAKFYAITDIEEAEAYLAHPVLGWHLVEISEALLKIDSKTATDILGSPDDIKLRSCMTLFAQTKNANPVFRQILDKYFAGILDELTLRILSGNRIN